jgi:hypothetical protein
LNEEGGDRMKKIYYIPLLLFLFFSFSSCTIAPKEPEEKDPTEEIAEQEPADEDTEEQPADENNGEQPADEDHEGQPIEDIDDEQPVDDIDEDQPEEPRQYISLQLVEISEDMVGIDLTNTVPVRGVQFDIEGVQIIDVITTSRSDDFIASFNQGNGTVIMVSFSGDEIPPGQGRIAEILFDGKGLARLSEIVIAD